ncbi:glycoside hydrolase family 36 protein [Pseudoclostridium thermosuccinogenes]|uniref:glycoside hydrolase family 36 protein n=1 Tax=Clostridium thermosuccinogenes TaxID=84032 RepID=UPI002FD9B846
MSNVVINSKLIKLIVDSDKGTYSAFLPDGSPLLMNAVSKAKWKGGEISTADNLTRKLTQEEFSDEIGHGHQVVMECNDAEKKCTLTVKAKVYDDIFGTFFEATLENCGSESFSIIDLEPLSASLYDNSSVYLQDYQIGWLKILTNGYMFMDTGRVENIGLGRSVQSRWNTAVVSRFTGHTLSAGYVTFDVSEGEVILESDWRYPVEHGRGGLGLVSRSQYAPVCMLPPGRSLRSDWFGLIWADNSNEALMQYAKCVKAIYHVEKKKPLMGWCSWYYTYTNTSEDEILRNARFIAEHLKDYGLEVVQIDDGYQKMCGEWEANEKFPHGMGWLASEIRKLGLKPGLWVAPYSLNEGSEVEKNHPEWCGRDRSGERKKVGSGYALDPTHPQALEWLKNLFIRVRRDWGYDMVKVDFSYSSLLEIEQFYDNTQGRAAAYRKALQTIRDAIGKDCHMLDCGPMNAVGINDSWRLEWDFDRLNWRQYTKELESNAPAIAKRYYLHNNFWSNDPDIIGFSLLNEAQGRSLASIMALSGGTVISGDQLYALPEAKLALLKKILPVYGEAARPLDLFESDFPTLYRLDVDKPFGNWTVLGVFNWSENSWTRREINIKELLPEYDISKALVFEFWSQQVVKPCSDGIITVDLKPGECAVFAIRKKEDHPVLAGSDRHVLQGAVELNQLSWDEATLTLSGELNSVARSNPTLTIWVPDGYKAVAAEIDNLPAVPGETYNNITRLRIPCSVTGKLNWSVTFTKAI